jgi:hypothetical protein
MFSFLFRVIGALFAAAVAGFGVVFIAALSMDAPAMQERAGCVTFFMLAGGIVGFVWMYRRLGSGKWEERRVKGQIRKLQAQAVSRNIGPRATLVADVLGGGSYATGMLRISWNGSGTTVDAAQGGVWQTVFTGRFHPEVAGQEVPGGIRPTFPFSKNPRLQKEYSVETKRVGHQPARWEVLGYIPGEWEEELNRLWETAKEARLEGEKGRFGL